MKHLEEIQFDATRCTRELAEFGDLLRESTHLQERAQVLPFFQNRRHLSAFIGTYASDIGPADLIAQEFEIAGDFRADFIVGSAKTQTFCLIEMENAAPGSIFSVQGNKGSKEWGRRFEHGFGQLVDWFYALDDLKGTERFTRDFGYGHARFHGLLVIGRSTDLSQADQSRLRWRGERVLVNSHPVACDNIRRIARDA